MPRYHLIVEYDGTPFVGWQRQENGLSVQEVIEKAGKSVTGEAAPVVGAGRTDTGVHALAMSAHIDLNKDLEDQKAQDALNHFLQPYPVAILTARRVTEDFHARFSATGRHYLYRLVTRRAPLALEKNRLWRRGHHLDAEAMHEAAQAFIGKHDFTTFRSTSCQAKSPIKTVETASVIRQGDEIHFRCSAPSFLHNQIRSFVGSLEKVGAGRWPVASIKEALDAKDRSACGPVAPAHGLYFVKADYSA